MRLASSFRLERRTAIAAARISALCGVVFAVWATVFDKWSWAGFQRPIAYVIDGMFTLSLVKAGSEFSFVPLLSKEVPNLGAPFVANWNDFPLSDDHVFFFWGLVARLTGVIAALNLAFVSCAMGAAVSLYSVGRWLRLKWEACFVAGALYGLAPFLFYRSLHHFTLVNYWHVPLLVPLVMWVGSRRPLPFKSRRFKWAAIIAVLAGIHNVYYLNFALQLLALAIAAQMFRKQWKRAGTGVVVALFAVAAFVAVNVDTLDQQRRLGPNPSVAHRSAVEVEVYALRPFELFVPGGRHRLAAFAAAAERHKASALAVGEFPSMYLGVVGALGFIWLMVVTVRAVLLGQRPGWGRMGLFCAWLVFVSMDGGLMQMLQAVTGLVLFRSNNRVSIFLLMFALLFLARLLTHGFRRLGRPWLSLAASVLLVAVGAFDQTPTLRIDPNFPHWESAAVRENIAAADERLVAETEKRLAPGTAVFQLPVMQYPESGFLGRAPDYDQFRPYLFSKHLRFSYGNMKGRPEANWQSAVAAMPLPQQLAELKAKGFGALYVLRNAYAPAQLQQLVESLRAVGQTDFIESDYGDSFFVILKS
jgi:hypothetical protein